MACEEYRMSVDELPRELLLDAPARLERLERAVPQMLAVTAGETDPVALMATLSRLLWDVLIQANWCGFYRRVADAELAVGPYQGSLGCLRIPFSRGVCGLAARTASIQLIPDVALIPDHISCDARSRSELVVPLFDSVGDVRAVLDLDSPHHFGFCEGEAKLLDVVLRQAFASVDNW